jgi:GWxTD domain-containing protein
MMHEVKMRKSILMLLMMLPILVKAPFAQIQAGFGDELVQMPFHIDYAAFADTLKGNIRLEVYYKVFSSALTFEKRAEKFEAAYEMAIIVNRKGKQVTGTTRSGDIFADDYETTLSRQDFIIDVVEFDLQPDDYELVGILTDSFSEDKREEKKDLKLRKFGRKKPFLSALEFVREADFAEGNSKFKKDGMTVIPSVSRVYGYDEPEVLVYYQIYNDREYEGDYLVTYEVMSDHDQILSDTALFTGQGAVTGRLERFETGALLPGKYDLLVKVGSPGHDWELSAEGRFIFEWSALAIVKNDYKTAVDQLRYIASKDQIDKLTEAPDDKHIEAWENFWKSMDPSPGTPENELRDEYYRRIRYADLNFGIFGRNGWKTDMGMVYITYGPPDEIERHPFDIDRKPYQVWYYYERELRFVFVDFNGYGEYELQYPYDGDIRRLR